MASLLPIFSLLVMLFGGCGVRPIECVDHGACADGEGCIDHKCKAVDCVDSSRCDIGQYCATASYSCEAGCDSASDCLAGEDCDTTSHQCVEAECRSSVLDCNMGERCTGGDCQQDTWGHCEACNIGEQAMGGSPCGSDGYCVSFANLGEEAYCIRECSPSSDVCPAGLSCQAPFVGYPNDFFCFTDCSVAIENGWL